MQQINQKYLWVYYLCHLYNERGICLPDASNMLDLCKILNITINDLLSGEVVDMKDNEKC